MFNFFYHSSSYDEQKKRKLFSYLKFFFVIVIENSPCLSCHFWITISKASILSSFLVASRFKPTTKGLILSHAML